MKDLEPIGEGLEKMFSRLGLPNPGVMAAVMAEWEELAGPPWKGNSKPVVVRGRTLVVEASASSQVAFLKYGITKLLQSLAGRFGEGVITQIEVIPPRR
ncbi:MAG: DUF721 domain-containing protein [Actinomycetes bacterium]